MPRITTSDVPKSVVKALEDVAKRNHRTAAREAVVAIEGHILNQLLTNQPKRKP